MVHMLLTPVVTMMVVVYVLVGVRERTEKECTESLINPSLTR